MYVVYIFLLLFVDMLFEIGNIVYFIMFFFYKLFISMYNNDNIVINGNKLN